MFNHYVKSFSNRIKIAERNEIIFDNIFHGGIFLIYFWGRNIVFINFNITRRRLIANIGAIDCSEMKKDPY